MDTAWKFVLFVGGFPIQSHDLAIFFPLTVTINPPAFPGFQFEYPATPEVSQTRGNIFPAAQDPGYERW